MLGEETRKIKCGTKVGGGQDRLGRLDTNRGALGTREPQRLNIVGRLNAKKESPVHTFEPPYHNVR